MIPLFNTVSGACRQVLTNKGEQNYEAERQSEFGNRGNQRDWCGDRPGVGSERFGYCNLCAQDRGESHGDKDKDRRPGKTLYLDRGGYERSEGNHAVG